MSLKSTPVFCPSCGETGYLEIGRCLKCRHNYESYSPLEISEFLVNKDQSEINILKRSEEEREQIKNIVLVTTPTIPNQPIKKAIGVVAAECAFGMNLFKDIFAAFTDLLGGRSKSYQNTLKDARNTCLKELREDCYKLGGNAVVGVSLDYSEISGDGKAMLFLVASGTAVILDGQAE